MILLDISITIIVFLVGFNLKNFFSGFNATEKRMLDLLFFYHFGIAIIFYFYISNFGGDAIYYWSTPKNMSIYAIMDLVKGGSASGVIYLINYIPSNFLQLSFFTGNMIYASLGYLGFIYILKTLKYIFKDFSTLSQIKLLNIPIFPWIWFLPNFHFWSTGIGKDAILFFSISVFIYCLQNLKRHLFLLFVSVLLALAIRPHILLFLLVSFGVAFTLDGRLKGYQKLLIFIVFTVGFISIFRYVMEFIQLESLEASEIEQYATIRSTNLNSLQTGSGVDITSYPIPLKVFTFLFRPFFFDVNGILALVASMENFILFCFTIYICFKKPINAFKRSSYLLKGMLIYFLVGTIAFSLILGNLGIMLRQKNMLVPWLIIFGLWTLYSFNKNKQALNAHSASNK
jgi:hypothetical protein